MDFWREFVGWAGSALLVASILQPTLARLRWLNLGASALLVVYNALLGSAPMIALNVALVLINVWYLAIAPHAGRRRATATSASMAELSGRETADRSA